MLLYETDSTKYVLLQSEPSFAQFTIDVTFGSSRLATWLLEKDTQTKVGLEKNRLSIRILQNRYKATQLRCSLESIKVKLQNIQIINTIKVKANISTLNKT